MYGQKVSNTKNTLLVPFDIDHGELDGCNAEMAFVLGVEWQAFRTLLSIKHSAFSEMVHARNAIRVAGMVSRTGRAVRVRVVDHAWSEISVGARSVS